MEDPIEWHVLVKHLLNYTGRRLDVKLARMDAPEVQDLIDRYDAAWNAQDLDVIDGCHAPGIVFHNHTADEQAISGRAAVHEHVARIFERWPDMRFRRRRLYAREDLAVSEWTATATTPDGRRIEWDGIDVFPISEGRLARKDVYSSSGSPRVLRGD